ncbi:negative elongation factor E-like isoform X2 [Salvelinus alpinus]|uniref:negative elongation factor E-like isoform X2 n=1 Tax=Salvelinus alpinus TaxID=8036 RepID=UPI0039FBA341
METEAGPTNPIGHAAAPAGLVSSGRSSRKKSHSRDRSRLKGHDKDKEKEKDKDKEKEKDRDKDKEKEKEKDRDRDMGRAKAKRSDKQGDSGSIRASDTCRTGQGSTPAGAAAITDEVLKAKKRKDEEA